MRTDSQCIFCKIVSGETPCFKLHEDDDTLAFMDINPVSEGHALVASKEHWPHVHAVPEDMMAAVARTSKKIARGVGLALAPDGLNLIQCNGVGAAQSVDHFHMHVLPRQLGDDLKMNWRFTAGDRYQIEQVAEKIRKYL